MRVEAVVVEFNREDDSLDDGRFERHLPGFGEFDRQGIHRRSNGRTVQSLATRSEDNRWGGYEATRLDVHDARRWVTRPNNNRPRLVFGAVCPDVPPVDKGEFAGL